MKKLFILLTLSILVLYTSSCQNSAEEILQSTEASEFKESFPYNYSEDKFTQKGSYLEFNNEEAFLDIFNRILSNTYSIQKSPSLNNFMSLENKYKLANESDPLVSSSKTKVYSDATEEFGNVEIIENRVGSVTLSELLNEEGVIKIGKRIYKFEGNYAYIINDGNENTLKRLLGGEQYSNLENISYQKVIHPLIIQEDLITKSSSGGEYERSPIFITTNDSKRREHIKFNPYLLVIDNAQTEIVIEMEGRAQKKQLFGIWGTTFSDEMVWGEIHLNSGSWHYNQPPAGGMDIPQGTNYFTTGLKARTIGARFCGWAQKLGNTGGVSAVKASITFKAKKSEFQPTDWAGIYTNNYTSITK